MTVKVTVGPVTVDVTVFVYVAYEVVVTHDVAVSVLVAVVDVQTVV